MLRQVNGLSLHRGIIKCAKAIKRCQQCSYRAIEFLFVNLTFAHRFGQDFSVGTRRCWHLEIKARVCCTLVRCDSEPIRDDESFKAPLITQDALQEFVILGAIYAVHTVVRGHDAERSTFTYGKFERQQIQFAQCALINDTVDCVAFKFGVVADKVFDGCRNILRLNTTNKRCCQFS